MSEARCRNADFVFLSAHSEKCANARRHFNSCRDDFTLLNPNTRTCPVFRTSADAELTKKIYARAPVLINERSSRAESLGHPILSDVQTWQTTATYFTDVPGGMASYRFTRLRWSGTSTTVRHLRRSNPKRILTSGILPQHRPKENQTHISQFAPRYWVSETEVLNRLAPPTDEEQEAIGSQARSRPGELVRRQRERAPKWLAGLS